MTRHILFVDDEPNILDGLRRSLRPYRQEWEMQFTGSGPEALRLLASSPEPIDVVVTDTRMAGMDGDELLEVVRRDYPLVVRMVLTGQSNQTTTCRLVKLAHRVFSKPLAPEDLKAAIQRACSLQDLLRSRALAGLVSRIGSLPSPPLLHAQILGELQRSEGSITVVGKLISQDVGLTAKLMQVVNSALLGLRHRTTDAARAVTILGAEMTKALVLMTGVFTRYDPAALHPFSIDDLWDHSRVVSSLAGKIVEAESSASLATEARLAGLFHDVGRLVLVTQTPESYRKVLSLVKEEKMLVTEAEKQVFEATHAEVGAYLLGLWGLPTALVEAVAWHHTPGACPADRVDPLTGCHVAEALLSPEEGGPLDDAYLERLGLGDRLARWEELRENARNEG